MDRVGAVRALVVLGLLFAFGLAAAEGAPMGSHIGYMWPVGLAAGALIISPRQARPFIAGLVPFVAFATYRLADLPTEISAGYSITVALEAIAAQQLLATGKRLRIEVVDVNDLIRYWTACIGAAGIGGSGFALTALISDYGDPAEVAIAAFVTHLASLAVLLGLFRSYPGPRVSFGYLERTLAWSITLLITLLVFLPVEQPGLAFAVIPPLGWLAFRAPTREAMWQLVVVSGIASVLSNLGNGPFAVDQNDGLPPELAHLPLQFFLVCCAMITIPFSLAVAMQRRSADQALRERARSERLVQSARGIAIIGTDHLGRINLFSPAAAAILGYQPEEVYGQSTRMFHTDAELARQAADLNVDPTYVSIMRATAKLPPGTAREWQFVRKDGTARILSTILSPVTDELGRFVGYVATGDDITDRLDAQQALEGALSTERRAVRRLTQIDQLKDAFVSSVSHELRTPITNIVGYVELIQDGMFGDQTSGVADAMERIDQNSRRLLTLIDDLLTLSSLEHLDQRRRTSILDLGDVIHRAVDIVRPMLLRRDLELAVSIPPDPIPVSGDTSELERLVINLAANAVKFTPDGGWIAIRVRIEDDGTRLIEIEDTGIGIPEADRAQLFERFFRTDDARTYAVQGSGLGLSIAKAIAEIHGGRIGAESIHGQGSTFWVRLPDPSGVEPTVPLDPEPEPATEALF